VVEDWFTGLGPLLGTTGACALTGRSKATHYRRLKPVHGPRRKPGGNPATRLDDAERAAVLAVLNSPGYADLSPGQVYHRELDAGRYHCSERTMYRILAEHRQVRERRAQARHPARKKPELLADGPGQVWSWDITKLRGPVKGVWYQAYVLIDIYSRYVVGHLVAATESSELAEALIADAVDRHGPPRSVHADRGTSMTSGTVAELLAGLGIERSHSRPRVSNDNPYSEAQFKTLKYVHDFPERFGSLQDARTWCDAFLAEYNHEHRHSGIGYHTPASVHYGTAELVRAQRAQTLATAYRAHPERFNHPPTPPEIPTQAWINEPTPTSQSQ
jgi:transposase InsO family protein